MVYIVQGTRSERGAGLLRVRVKTKRDAIESAWGLRQRGLTVHITDPDGKPIEETEDECPEGARRAPSGIACKTSRWDVPRQ
jgi:hypothetical protein